MADRRWDLDALRGLLLLLMTLTHLPTRFSDPAGQPFGFVSAAEGFVLVSGFMAGSVYTARAQRHGIDAMQEAFLRRALKIYACQAALLVFLFTVIAAVGLLARQEAVTNLLSFYLQSPGTAVVSALLLVYSPALLDILPIYIVFMLASPVILVHGLHQGWRLIMATSVALWAAAQFGLGRAIYDGLGRMVDLPVRYEDIGAFDIFAWQFLWVLGLWMGSTSVSDAASETGRKTTFPRWMVGAAIAVAGVGFVWRHAVGQTPFPNDATLSLLFDKWHVGPLRLINLLALLALAIRFGPALLRRLPRLRVLELLGQASLPVFCAHLVMALTALAIWGAPTPERAWSIDTAILAVTVMVLCTVALVSREVDRRAAAVRAIAKAGGARVVKASGALKSRVATVRSRPR